MKLKTIGCALLLLVGCGDDVDNETKVQTPTKAAQEQQVEDITDSEVKDIAEVMTKVEELSLMTEEKKTLIEQRLSGNLAKTRSITINSEKYTSEATELVKGSKVFNVLMGEWGKIKGSIVVVSPKLQQEQLSQQFSLSSIENIAQDTYRLTPTEQKSLYGLYKALLALNSIKQVELEIDFSGESPARETY